MRISFDFKVKKKDDYKIVFDDYVNRISHFAKIGKCKKSDFEVVFVVGRDQDAEKLRSEELAKIVERRLAQGFTGLRVNLVQGRDEHIKLSEPRVPFWGDEKSRHQKEHHDSTSDFLKQNPKVRVLLTEEKVSDGLAMALAAEQIYRVLMINSGRSYHK